MKKPCQSLKSEKNIANLINSNKVFKETPYLSRMMFNGEKAMMAFRIVLRTNAVICYSPFRLTSLIYAEKFEFENPATMEGKQYKQTERFSVMAKGSGYFLPLDDKSNQRYKVKTNNMQVYDPYQIKKEELSGDISKLPTVQ